MQISRTQTANYPSNSPVSCFLNAKNSQKLNRKQNKTKQRRRIDWEALSTRKLRRNLGSFDKTEEGRKKQKLGCPKDKN